MFNISGNRTLCKWLATWPSFFGKTSLFDAGEFQDKKNASPVFPAYRLLYATYPVVFGPLHMGALILEKPTILWFLLYFPLFSC
jgi:hypothetical protein